MMVVMGEIDLGIGERAHGVGENEEDIMALLRTNPKVLERPVLISGQQAVIGRPPEDVLSLLDDA